MSGNIVLRKLQLSKEAVLGTAIPATALWRGLGVLDDRRVVTFPDENIGISVVDRSYTPKLGAGLAMPAVPMTFEQIIHLLESGISQLGTPVADGAGSGKIYTYNLWSTAKPTVKTRTIEGGDDTQKGEAEGCYVDDMAFEGTEGQAMTMAANWTGRQYTPAVFVTGATIAFVLATKKITDSANQMARFVTGSTIRVSGTVSNDGIYTVATGGVAAEVVVTESLINETGPAATLVEDWFAGGPTGLSVPTVEEALFGKSKLYLDAVGGTIGATQVSNTLLKASVKIKGGPRAQDTGSGALYYSHLEYDPPSMVFDLTLLFNSSAKAEKAIYEARTSRQLRLKAEGSALGTPGTTYTYKTIIFDAAGQWEKFSVLAGQNGNDIVTATFRAGYNSTAALLGRAIVVNEVSSLP